MSLLLAFTFGQWILGTGMILVCGLLILVILVQQASGGGLVGAFGGGGGGGAFGAKTGDVFTVITCALAALFLIMAVLGNYIFVPMDFAPPQPVITTAPTPPSGGTTPPPVSPGGIADDVPSTPMDEGDTGAADDAATNDDDSAPADADTESDTDGS